LPNFWTFISVIGGIKMAAKNLIAVDLGASSGRLISGTFDQGKIVLKEQFRFSNQPIEINGSLYWDYLKIIQEIKYGLSIAEKDLGQIESLSVDTWGVDYGLLDQEGELVRTPHSYRDARTTKTEDQFNRVFSTQALFEQTGVQKNVINTINQLFAEFNQRPYLRKQVANILLMPNLIEYFLSGVKSNEFTIASTSGLLDQKSQQLQPDILKQLGLKASMFGEISRQGAVLGPILPAIKNEVGLKSEIQIINAVGHDTAAAVLALPIEKQNQHQTAFISCGTWSIVGIQTDVPVINELVVEQGLTNEGCFGGGNRLLSNITGLWIVQELQKEWSFQGEMIPYTDMVDLAKEAADISSFINPQAPEFISPGNMAAKVEQFLTRTHQEQPKTKGELLKVIYQSLALSYAQTIQLLEQCSQTTIQSVYMFGGGIQNDYLVQLTADYTQKTIVIGPVEASVMGNILGQLIVAQQISEQDRMAILQHSFSEKRVRPSDNTKNQRLTDLIVFKSIIENSINHISKVGR